MPAMNCLIIGGGPAGLTAAIYLARFHLGVVVIDAGDSRANLIPRTRNHAGFPEGISGVDLLARMRAQAQLYGVDIRTERVDRLAQTDDGFVANAEAGTLRARLVLLATGVVNRRPSMISDSDHARALAGGQLRYCPICDAYEVTDRRIAVLGTGERGVNEASFLRSYSADVTLVAPEGGHDLSPGQRRALAAAGIAIAGACGAIELVEGQGMTLHVDGAARRFDTLYPALGSDIRSELAAQVGANRSDDGCLTVDAHQRTSVVGLYAAGDVVLGLDQISHAMGEGGVAATTMRNDLACQEVLHRAAR